MFFDRRDQINKTSVRSAEVRGLIGRESWLPLKLLLTILSDICESLADLAVECSQFANRRGMLWHVRNDQVVDPFADSLDPIQTSQQQVLDGGDDRRLIGTRHPTGRNGTNLGDFALKLLADTVVKFACIPFQGFAVGSNLIAKTGLFREPHLEFAKPFVILERIDPLHADLGSIVGFVQIQQILNRPAISRLILFLAIRLKIQRCQPYVAFQRAQQILGAITQTVDPGRCHVVAHRHVERDDLRNHHDAQGQSRRQQNVRTDQEAPTGRRPCNRFGIMGAYCHRRISTRLTVKNKNNPLVVRKKTT